MHNKYIYINSFFKYIPSQLAKRYYNQFKTLFCSRIIINSKQVHLSTVSYVKFQITRIILENNFAHKHNTFVLLLIDQ